MNSEEIIANKAAREDALAAFGLIAADERPRFWEQLVRLVQLRVPPSPSTEPKPMSEAEVIAFENEEVTFGIHRGKRIYEVPADYWDVICKSEFNVSLRRYMASDRFKKGQA